MNMPVTFRRIHGRIVPIKMSRDQKVNAAEGVGLVGAGLGAAAGAGALHRKLVNKSLGLSVTGWKAASKANFYGNLTVKPLRQHSLFARAARVKGVKKLKQISEATLTAGTKISRFTPALRLGGLAIGSALVGAGVAKFYKSVDRKASDTKVAAIGGSVATAAFITGGFGAAGLRQSMKGIYKGAYPVIRAIKGGLRL